MHQMKNHVWTYEGKKYIQKDLDKLAKSEKKSDKTLLNKIRPIEVFIIWSELLFTLIFIKSSSFNLGQNTNLTPAFLAPSNLFSNPPIVFKENIKALLKATDVTTTIIKDLFNRTTDDDKTPIDFNINNQLIIKFKIHFKCNF